MPDALEPCINKDDDDEDERRVEQGGWGGGVWTSCLPYFASSFYPKNHCIILHFFAISPSSHPLGYPASRSLFSHLKLSPPITPTFPPPNNTMSTL